MAVSVDATDWSSAPGAAVLSKTNAGTFTISASSTCVLIKVGITGNSRTVSTVTVGAASATLHSRQTETSGANGGGGEIWKVTSSIPSGSQTVTVTMNATAEFSFICQSYLGNNGTVGTTVVDNTHSGNASNAVTSSAGDLVSDMDIMDLGGTCAGTSCSAGGSQTIDTTTTSTLCTDNEVRVNGSTEAGPTPTMTWTQSNVFYLWMGVNLPASGGGSALSNPFALPVMGVQ